MNHGTPRRAPRPFARSAALIAAQCILLVLLPATITLTAAAYDASHITVGFSGSAFLNIDRDSAQTIAGFWTRLFAKTHGITSDTRIYTDLAGMERDLNAKRPDLLILLTSEYLELKDKVPLQPLYVSANGNGVHDRQVLVVRRASGISSVSDLKNKALLRQSGVDTRDIWVTTLFLRQGIRNPDHFLAANKSVRKPSAAVLPVFFGKADACVVSGNGLRLMSELNPQLKKELVVIEEGPLRPNAILVVRKNLSSSQIEKIRDSLGTISQDQQGGQLLTLFRMSRLEPFRNDYLTSMEKLFKEYHELKYHSARRAM